MEVPHSSWLSYALAVYETNEVTDCVQFIVIVCGTDSIFHVHAEPSSLCSFRGIGEDLFLKVNSYFFEMGLRKIGRVCDRQWQIHVFT
jgi:hypothetical protein